jgi:hypothetical protein
LQINELNKLHRKWVVDLKHFTGPPGARDHLKIIVFAPTSLIVKKMGRWIAEIPDASGTGLRIFETGNRNAE